MTRAQAQWTTIKPTVKHPGYKYHDFVSDQRIFHQSTLWNRRQPPNPKRTTTKRQPRKIPSMLLQERCTSIQRVLHPLCYNTMRRLQLCPFFLFHAPPSFPHVACHHRAWPQRTTCDLASHDQQSGPLASGTCRCMSLSSLITVPSSYAYIWTLQLCQHVPELAGCDWVGP